MYSCCGLYDYHRATGAYSFSWGTLPHSCRRCVLSAPQPIPDITLLVPIHDCSPLSPTRRAPLPASAAGTAKPHQPHSPYPDLAALDAEIISIALPVGPGSGHRGVGRAGQGAAVWAGQGRLGGTGVGSAGQGAAVWAGQAAGVWAGHGRLHVLLSGQASSESAGRGMHPCLALRGARSHSLTHQPTTAPHISSFCPAPSCPNQPTIQTRNRPFKQGSSQPTSHVVVNVASL